jgi:hypothetical protein
VNATRGASLSRLGAGAKISRTNRAARVRETTRMFEQDRDRLPRHRDHESDERQWRAGAGESEPRTHHHNRRHWFNRGRNSFQLVTSRMNGIAIAANPRLNGNPATKQNGVRATGTEISGAPMLRRGAIATAALTIPIG